MTVITKKNVNDHCRNLGIFRGDFTEFTIPDGVTEIGEHAFFLCTSLTSITIPDSVSQIGEYAFQWCRSLSFITIPNGVTTIGREAFYKCTALTSVTIPDGVTTIGREAFERCTSLTSITIPDSVTEIGHSAFKRCTSLTSITIPHGVTKIETHTFIDCTSLISITIPDSVTEIGICTFLGCTSLKSITIPDSITTIDTQAFLGCTSLTQIICNNPDLFADQNTPNRDTNICNKDQLQFISTTDYFKENYIELLIAIEGSGFKSNNVSPKELDLIIKLEKEDFLPNWNTIATTFNERSMDQIRAILHHFNKASCMPNTVNSILLKKVGREPASINSLSMFLNPIDHTNLSMTAKNVILRTITEEKKSTSYCSIQ